MLFRQPLIHRRWKQKPRLPVNRAKVAHQKAPVIRTEST
jgi:hypothetical protein